MTQTTAGRITEIIREHLKFYAGSGEWAAAVEAGQEIAAEIDALTRERDEARRLIGIYNTSRDEVIAQLCEIDDGRLAEIDRLKKELAEARAEAERLRPAAEAFYLAESKRRDASRARAAKVTP